MEDEKLVTAPVTDEAPEYVELDESDEAEESAEIDYKAELEKTKKRLGQAEHVIQKLKSNDEESKEINLEETIQLAVNRALLATKQESVEGSINDALSGITNEDERALVEHHYRNTIKVSGLSRAEIINDINVARAIANAPKILKENSELKLSVATKGKMSSDSSSSGHTTNKSSRSVWTPEQIAYMKKRGIDPKTVEGNLKNANTAF